MSSGEPGAELARLPIFPLANVQLFPHALLPLHVFEPRYRALVKSCMEGSRMMAVALLLPGYESDYEGRPPVATVCGVGRIISHEALPDGRSNILLQGTTRARILDEWPPSEPFRVVRAEPLVDRTGGPIAAQEHTLRALAGELAKKIPSGGEVLRALIASQAELGPLTDVLAAALVLDPDERQSLLEMIDVVNRAEHISAQIGRVLGEIAPTRGPSN